MPYSDHFLRILRNQVKIDRVIDLLMLETRYSRDLMRFRCPLCYGFHTATNPETNLGRCFDCQVNFNPIDLVMVTTGHDFIQTIEYLKKHMDELKEHDKKC